nr:protein DCL, chloroplastic-like [Ipomoea trifida]
MDHSGLAFCAGGSPLRCAELQTMAAPLLFRVAPLLRLRFYHHQQSRGLCFGLFNRRLFCASTEPSQTPEDSSSAGQNPDTTVLRVNEPPRFPRWSELDYQEWKVKEAEILQDIKPVISLVKDIIHSTRYLDGERLTAEDEKIVVEKLLAHHPHCEDKIGCGLDSIMVDRHPQFRQSRCLFVVRTDGGWIDFSYHKCLRRYVRDRYPSFAEIFIRKHLKMGS